MDMEMEVSASLEANVDAEVGIALERLAAAAHLLEVAAERLTGMGLSAAGAGSGAGLATESELVVSAREEVLEQRLAAAEATITALRAEAAQVESVRGSARKTAPVSAGSLASREGVVLEGSALDASLRSLSIEQRIAVKSELLRSGLIG